MAEKVTAADHGVYTLYGEIRDDSCKAAVDWIILQNIKKENESLTLIINSSGGGVWAGFGLIEAILGSKIPITTVATGVIASMGLIIFMAGKHRILTPRTTIMSHQFATQGLTGKYHELMADSKYCEQLQQMLVTHYQRHTKQSKKVIEEKLLGKTDLWLTPKQALEYGMADEIKYI